MKLFRSLWLFPVLALLVATGSAQAQSLNAKPVEDEKNSMLETIGLLAGLNLYQTYLNIGFLADAKSEDLYGDEEVLVLLSSIQAPLEKVETQIGKLTKHPTLSQEDRDSLENIRKLTGLLREQGKELKAFWTNGKEDHAHKYDAARQEAWKGISKLLGMNEKQEAKKGGASEEIPYLPLGAPAKKP